MIGTALRDDVWTRLSAGAPLDGLGLGRVHGRWDLRGIGFEPPTREAPASVTLLGGRQASVQRIRGIRKIAGVRLTGLDFSGTKLDHLWLTDCDVEDCLFDGASLKSFRNVGSRLRKCSFAQSSLRDSVLGARLRGARARYEQATFVGADMRGALPGHTDFIDCDFTAARMKGLEFWDATLTRCRFGGLLENVIFAGRKTLLGRRHEETLVDVDFTTAEFRWVEFRHLNLGRVKLPSRPDHLVVQHPKCVLEWLSRSLATRDDRELLSLRSAVDFWLQWAGPHHNQSIFVLAECGRTDDERHTAEMLIREAITACSDSRSRVS